MLKKMDEVDNLNVFLVEEKKYLSTPLEVTEKLDGSNFSAHLSLDEDLNTTKVFRSRNGEISSANYSMFRETIDFVSDRMHKLKSTEIIFGENMYKHRIDYGDIPSPFYAFGIYDVAEQKFITNWAKRCKKLDIPTVPIIKESALLTFDELRALSIEPTLLGSTKTEREGIVIKSYVPENSWMCKVVNPKYFESRTAKAPRAPEIVDDATKSYVEKHATDNRIIKAVLRLRDEQGIELSMMMMQALIKAVAIDILKECKDDMPAKLHAKQFDRFVADACRKTLPAYLNGEII